MRFLTPVWNYVDALVHPSAQQDALTAARHRAFIAPRLIGSFAALASLPVYIAFRGRAERARSRRLRLAGGADSHRLFPLAHRPLRKRACYLIARPRRAGDGGRLAHRRHRLLRRDLAGGGAAGGGAVGVAPGGGAGFDLRAWRRRLAAAAERLPTCCRRPSRWRASMARWRRSESSPPRSTPPASRSAPNSSRAPASWLLYAEEDRYRLLARNMTDVITRHGQNGAVLFVSPAAEPLFGVRAAALDRARPVRPRACRRPAGLPHRARRCGGARRRPLGRIPHPPRRRRPAERRPFRLGGNALPAARTAPTASRLAASAKWSRCCAT